MKNVLTFEDFLNEAENAESPKWNELKLVGRQNFVPGVKLFNPPFAVNSENSPDGNQHSYEFSTIKGKIYVAHKGKYDYMKGGEQWFFIENYKLLIRDKSVKLNQYFGFWKCNSLDEATKIYEKTPFKTKKATGMKFEDAYKILEKHRVKEDDSYNWDYYNK
jgi:hypothetical protein